MISGAMAAALQLQYRLVVHFTMPFMLHVLTRKVPFSRTTSTNTVQGVQRTVVPLQGSTVTGQRPKIRSLETEADATRTVLRTDASPDSPKASLHSSSGSSSYSAAPPISQSRAIARRPRFSPPKSKGKAAIGPPALAEEGEEEEEEAPAFLPFTSEQNKLPTKGTRSSQPYRAPAPQSGVDRMNAPDTGNDRGRAFQPAQSTSSSASASSAAPLSSGPSIPSPPARPTSHHTQHYSLAAAAALSPRLRRTAAAAGGSETGTPSMGSSFSDLDDASVTQSALEEALAREMRAGKGSLGVVSRMGGLWRGSVPGGVQGQSSRGS